MAEHNGVALTHLALDDAGTRQHTPLAARVLAAGGKTQRLLFCVALFLKHLVAISILDLIDLFMFFTAAKLKKTVAEFYEGDSRRAQRFRYRLLIFDIFLLVFLVGTSFTSHSRTVELVDAIVGILLLVEFAARFWISSDRAKFLINPFGIADILVIASLLAPIVGEGVAFLRVARMLRLLRSYQLVKRLREDFILRTNEQTILSAINLGVFLFVMTAIVYETQHHTNPSISNYVDALYFTVTALTTTGFGDVVLQGTPGRLISVIIMIFGVSLFLRLVQVMLRPSKVDYKCPDCGLRRHDHDAVHCKACGRLLNIEDEGAV